MRTLFKTIIVIIAVSITAFPQFNKAGRTAMQFLKIGVGARQVGAGEASIAGMQDVNSIFWNPAAVTGIQNGEASFSYNQWIADLNVFSGAIGYNLGVGTVVFNYMSLDYGDIPEAYATGNGNDTRTGNTFSGSDLAIGLGLAKQFTDKLSIGVNFRYVREDLFVYSSDLFSFDIGSFYNTGWKGIRIGMSAQNFSTPARWLNTKQEEQQSYDLPLVYRIGVSIDLMGAEDLFLGGDPMQHKVTVNMDAIHSNDYGERLNMGLEYTFMNMFSLRGGYKINYEEGNLSVGAGFKYDFGPVNLRVDYSYVQYDYLQSPNRISVVMGF